VWWFPTHPFDLPRGSEKEVPHRKTENTKRVELVRFKIPFWGPPAGFQEPDSSAGPEREAGPPRCFINLGADTPPLGAGRGGEGPGGHSPAQLVISEKKEGLTGGGGTFREGGKNGPPPKRVHPQGVFRNSCLGIRGKVVGKGGGERGP